jgi:hypothetical protein
MTPDRSSVAPMAVEQAAVILDVFAKETSPGDDLLRDAQEHVSFTLTVLNPEMKPFWLRVLWCLTPQGNA